MKYGTARQLGVAIGVFIAGVSMAAGTTVSAQNANREYDLISSGRVTGLFRTGVSDANQKLGQDADDPHWIIDRVIRPDGLTNPTCQFAHRGGTILVSIPTISSQTPIPARTIMERPSEAGFVTSRNPQITGDASGDDTGVRNLNGTSPWKFNVNNARWIGQNLYGQNSTNRACKDPTNKNPKRMAEANIYVFKLRGGFRIDDRIDLSSVKLRLGAAVDNTIKVVVNGVTVPARLTPSADARYRDVNEPGFARNSPSIETQQVSGIFKERGERNELELMIQSTYSHTGLLIKNIEMVGKDQGGPADFNLVPSVQLNERIVMPGRDVGVISSVRNTGRANSSNASWQLTKFVVRPNDTSYSTETQENRSTPENHYRHDALRIVNGTRVFAPGDTGVGDRQDGIDDYPVGTKICYATSVRPYSESTSADVWRHGAPTCVIIGKKPQVNIWGGDLRVGAVFGDAPVIPGLKSMVSTSVSGRNGKTFGSWVEYGIIAPGRVINTASASGLIGGTASPSQGEWSRLTFANTPQFGEFKNESSYVPDVITAVESLYDVDRSPEVSGTVQLTQNTKMLRSRTADVTLSGYTFNTPGQTVVIYAPTRTVTINGDIRYGNMRLTAPRDIPQLIIIANTIRINSAVSQIDGWLIAQGSNGQIDTCGDVSGNLSIGLCDRGLTVNGPVMAKQLLLRRTAGAGAGSDEARTIPAETFNLRPDAYLWATATNNDLRRVLTTHTMELPPKF